MQIIEISLIFLTIMFFIILLQKRFMYVSLHNLLKGMLSITKGEFPSRIQTNRKDIVGLLSSAFNQMNINLKASRYLLENRLQELLTLEELSQTMTSVLEMDKLLPLVLKKVEEIMKVKELIIMLIEDDELIIKASRGIKQEDLEKIKFKIGEGIAGWVAQRGEAVILNDAPDDRHFKEIDVSSKPKSLLCVPLIVKEKIIGVISLADKISGEYFTENDLRFFNILSPYIAISLENARLYQLAITDELTNLYVYRYFKKRLDEEIKRAIRYEFPLSLILLDIDHFKKLNDTFGHSAGDFVLKELSFIIKRCIREVDIPCRYGGEEFTIILPETDLSGGITLAERLRKNVEEYNFHFDGKIVKTTISLGIADFSKEDNMEDFIKKVDSLLYEAKREGRNRVKGRN